MEPDCKEEPDYLGHRQRLRNRFLKSPESLPDYELLELVLMTALPRRDVKPLAKDLIRKYKDFAGVINAPLAELVQFDGLKENSATILKIVKEAAIRLTWQTFKNTDAPVLASYDALVDYCRCSMCHQEVEEFRIIYLNKKYRVIGEEVQQRGTIDHVSIHPREVVKAAVANNAAAIVMVHNHPTGVVTPSQADMAVTKLVKEACKAFSIELLDHIIIGESAYFSFRDKRVL